MPLNIVRNDITNMTVDAIVNAANSSLLGGGGVDGAIHKAAGPMLLEECRTLNGCATGDAKITKGYNLKASYVIHTVGPIWGGGNKNERNLLISCYKRSLELAVENNLTSIAFPLISAGVYGYPVDQAFKVAVDTIGDFLLEHELDAYIVVFDSKALSKASLITPEIKEYIDDNYVATHKSFIRNIFDNRRRQMYEDEVDMSYDDACSMVPSEPQFGSSLKNKSLSAMPAPQYYAPSSSMASSKTLEEALSSLDESFTQSLLRIIDEKGLKDSYVYKRANIDRKLFSKIRSDIHYHPKKNTVLALAVALELTIDETEALLKKAGFAISPSNIGDIIVQYHIENKKFNVNEINMVLFAHDMPILGST